MSDYKKYEPIGGKWYLSNVLGKGAYGTVFEAETRDYGQMKSALKIVSIPSSPSDIESYREEHFGVDEKSVSSYFYGFVEEYLKEIKIMAKLKGKSNIVSIEDYDIKEHTDSIGWDILIRMELLTSLNKWLAGKDVTESIVVKLGIDICKALEECEKLDIIHRDIKPSNIFVSDTGEFKLGDFGVARTLEKTSSGLSKKGTYTYMAPEVYKGEEDYSSNVDTYSLGIVMYKLLNNNFEPFRTQLTSLDEENALKNRLKNEPMPIPANASEQVAKIILKACNYNPSNRFKSPTQMRMELESVNVDDAFNPKKNFIPTLYASPNAFDEPDEPTHGLFDDAPVENKDNADVFKKESEETKLKTKVIDNVTEAITKEPFLKRWIALAICFFYGGWFGLHDLFLGNKKRWKKKLFFNYFFVGWVKDIILIAIGKYKNEDGTYLK